MSKFKEYLKTINEEKNNDIEEKDFEFGREEFDFSKNLEKQVKEKLAKFENTTPDKIDVINLVNSKSGYPNSIPVSYIVDN